ncbi:hypothetical protein RKD18_006829 [Streptomyces phaeoluteigriseus]
MPPASSRAAAATCSAMSWSGSVPATEFGMIPNRVTSTRASPSTNPPRRAYTRSATAGSEAVPGW